MAALGTNARSVIERADLQRLLDALRADGYQVVGPTVRDAAIVYDAIERVADLPAGWTDRQDGGRYRLERRGDQALFGYALGPHAWKRLLHLPGLRLASRRRSTTRRATRFSACAAASCARLRSRTGC
jgi:sulfhydrogenase subunit beta (sulfur reductase)